MYNTIKIKKYADVIEEMTSTAVAIKPGALLEITSANLVQAHSNAGENVLPMFAIEDELQGNGIDDSYAVSSQVQVWIPGRGDMVYGMLADGESVVPGDFLESAGDGTVKKHVADSGLVVEYPNAIIGVSVDTLDMSGSAGEDPENRIVIRII